MKIVSLAPEVLYYGSQKFKIKQAATGSSSSPARTRGKQGGRGPRGASKPGTIGSSCRASTSSSGTRNRAQTDPGRHHRAGSAAAHFQRGADRPEEAGGRPGSATPSSTTARRSASRGVPAKSIDLIGARSKGYEPMAETCRRSLREGCGTPEQLMSSSSATANEHAGAEARKDRREYGRRPGGPGLQEDPGRNAERPDGLITGQKPGRDPGEERRSRRSSCARACRSAAR